MPGIGPIRVDTAFGGDSFVLVDAADLGLAVEPGAAAELAEVGALITAAANEQLGFSHPQYPEWTHLSFCQIAGRLERTPDGFELQSTSVIDPGKLDRSPTGTGVSARLAVLHARGLASVGDRLTMRSVIGSTFVGSIDGVLDDLGDGRPAVLPSIRGRAWITGVTPTWSTPPIPGPPATGSPTPGQERRVDCHAQTFRFGLQTHGPIEGMSWTDTAKYAEQQGYSSIMLPDHFHGQYGPMTALAAAAAVTTEIKVGALFSATTTATR